MSEDRPVQDAVSAAEPAFTKPLAPGSKAIYSKDGTKVITVQGTKKQQKKKSNKANGHSPTTAAAQQPSSPTPSSTNSASSHHDHQHHHDHHHRHTNTTHRNQQHHGHSHFHDIDDDDDIELVAGHNVNFEYHGEALVTIGNPSSKGKKSQDKIWDMSTDEERERIKKFWAELSEGERRDLVKIEKNTMLQKMKDQQRHSCSCSVCGRKRLAIEQELESLYDAYYADLENVAEASTHLHRELERSQQSHSNSNGRLHGDDTFANNLTIQGGILTVADDLLKNDGKKFIDMMEKLAERRLAREEETLAQAAVYDHDQYDDEEDDEEDDDDLDDIDEEIDDDEDDDDEDDDDYDDDDYEDEDDDDVEDELSEERRAEDGRKMLQIFAARMFEQRVLNAYREKVAQERQQKLLDELDEEDRVEKEREAKRLRDRQKKKEKKKQQQLAKEEEKRKKEEEKQRLLDAQKAEQQRKQEEAKKRKAEQKAKLDAEKRAKEDERKKRIEEDKKRELEKLKKKKEKEEREKEEKRKKELEEKRKVEQEAKKRDDEIKRQQEEEHARRLQEEERLKEEVEKKRKEEEQRKREEERQQELASQRERDERERLRLQNQRQLLAALSSGTPPPPGASIPQLSSSSSSATALAAAAVNSAAAAPTPAASGATSNSTTTTSAPPHLHSMNPQNFPYPPHIPHPQGMSVHPAMPLPQSQQQQQQQQPAQQQPAQQQQQAQQPAPQIWGYNQPMFMGQQQQNQHNSSPPQVHTHQQSSYIGNNGFGLGQSSLANGFASPLLNQANNTSPGNNVPMPIQRPGSTSQGSRNTGMDDIMRRLGSRALMEDDDEFYPHRTHAANGTTSSGNNSVPQSSLNSPVHRLAPTLMNGNDMSNGLKVSTPGTSSIFGLDWSAGPSSAGGGGSGGGGGGSRLWSSPTASHGIVNKPASPWGSAIGDRRVSPMPHIGVGGASATSVVIGQSAASQALRPYAIQAIRQSPSDSDGYVPVQMLFHATQKLAPMSIDQLDLQLALSVGVPGTGGDRFDAVRDHVGLITKVKYIPTGGFENNGGASSRRVDNVPKTPAQLMQSQWEL